LRAKTTRLDRFFISVKNLGKSHIFSPFLDYLNYLPIFVPSVKIFSGSLHDRGRFAGVRGPMSKAVGGSSRSAFEPADTLTGILVDEPHWFHVGLPENQNGVASPLAESCLI
jgi:hypothetical protein